jgi:hypothetical protein
LPLVLGSYSLGLKLLVVFGGDGDVFDDWNIESGLALSVLVGLRLFEFASLVLFLLIVLQLGLHLFQIDLGLPLGRNDIYVELCRVLIIETMMQHFQLLQAPI